ncbi:hypothetical protein [Streptomyces sp. AC495_CC817]|uniref:hypothetical protein n=1 Tax=Streptomyces sp. AC495_CC817 TaxID=2823900 RepID=UPI001C25CFA3|nr:hypothetical protein [Streptomyces sp. AC495_CC817]
MTDPRFEDIAAALYSGAPEGFTAARNARASAVDDPALATLIRALRKPTVAAWVVNLFAQERSAQLGEALQLAAELRDAQEDLDAVTLARLGRDRRALTARLATEAASLATVRGARVSPSTLEAVRQTISAAFYSADAASAVSSGRLVRELSPDDSGTDIADAVGGGLPDALPRVTPPADELAARRERRRAEKELHDAEKEHAAAAKDAEKAARIARDHARASAELATRIAALEEELTRTREDSARAHDDAVVAEERSRSAAERLAAADDVRTAALRALENLEGGRDD